ncbi:MAG: glutamine synthetase family protein [Halioglobus sp.]
MPRTYSFEDLQRQVEQGAIDTVVVAMPDMQGRLMGKRFQAQHFVKTAWEETHACNYLLATDMEMVTVDGYAATSWSAGYGDYTLKPDMRTLRQLPWLEGTALVLCDVLDHHTHAPVPHAPRAVLQRQLQRLDEMGLVSAVATELEFFIFRESFEALSDQAYRSPTTISTYNEDYHVFQTTKEESLLRRVRNGLQAAGIDVENSKGEASAGQAEINVSYCDGLTMADNHVVLKNAIKEMAYQEGKAITFMAKWDTQAAGSSSHIHQSLQRKDGTPVFHDPDAAHGMSDTMRHYLAGLLTYADDITLFLAPYVNSYKRFSAATFAPTKAVWSIDNRTAGYRIVAPGSTSVRVECRVGGSDLNPYLAIASQIAAGIKGIQEQLPLEPAFTGDAYQAGDARDIPEPCAPRQRHCATRACCAMPWVMTWWTTT